MTIRLERSAESMANDPAFADRYAPLSRLWRPPAGTAAVLQAPHVAAFNITGDIEIVMRVGLPDWTPAAACALAAKRTVGDGMAWQLTISPSGTMMWSFFPSGGGGHLSNDGILTPPAPLTDGLTYWLRFARTASTGAITGGHHADQSDEPDAGDFTAWTPSGARTSGNMEPNNAPIEFGSERSGSNPMTGFVRQLIVRDGSTEVAHFDDRYGVLPFRDEHGNVWSMSGTGWGWQPVDPS